MPDVISNTSPLQYLYRIGKLDLLAELFGRVARSSELKVLLEAKSREIIAEVKPLVTSLRNSGMRISDEIELRVLALAQEI